MSDQTTSTSNIKKIAGVSIAGIFFLLILYSCSDDSLPTCDSSDALNTAEEVINDMPIVQSVGAQFVELKNITEEGFNKNKEIRACSAALITTAGEDSLLYNISWANKDKKTFYVEVKIQ